jgi:hypothetical protein
MKKENENWNELFETWQDEWDVTPLPEGHENRFKNKLKQKKSFKKYLIPLSIAASLLLMMTITLFNKAAPPTPNLHFASQETKQTDSIFTVIIKKELDKLNEKESPENKKIIADADYEKIILELEKNGESKPILQAMIANLQTRISFLQTVLQHIEENERKINIPDEKTM